MGYLLGTSNKNIMEHFMRIVTDGELYAVEKGWWKKKYHSLYQPCWHEFDNSYITCWGTLEQATNILRLLKKNKKITPIPKID